MGVLAVELRLATMSSNRVQIELQCSKIHICSQLTRFLLLLGGFEVNESGQK